MLIKTKDPKGSGRFEGRGSQVRKQDAHGFDTISGINQSSVVQIVSNWKHVSPLLEIAF